MPTLFTRIVNGEIPCHKIMEDEKYLAFLDIRPIHLGHTLVIPKQEINYMFDMEDDLLSGLIIFSKKVAKKIREAIACERIGMMVAGIEVPHAHIHLIPITGVKDLNFALAKPMADDELKKIAEIIRLG